MRNYLMGRYMAAVKILKSFLLAGFQTTCFAIYFIDCLSLISS